MRLGEKDVLTEEMEIGSTTPPALNVIVSTRGARVEGEIDHQTASDRRLPVLLAPIGKFRHVMSFYTGTLSDKGKFQMAGITPGKYRMFAFEPSPAAMDLRNPDLLDRLSEYGESLEIAEGATLKAHPKLITEQQLARLFDEVRGDGLRGRLYWLRAGFTGQHQRHSRGCSFEEPRSSNAGDAAANDGIFEHTHSAKPEWAGADFRVCGHREPGPRYDSSQGGSDGCERQLFLHRPALRTLPANGDACTVSDDGYRSSSRAGGRKARSGFLRRQNRTDPRRIDLRARH
jgi:hypothetical protein